MVDNLANRTVVSELPENIGERIARDVADMLNGEGKFAYLKKRREECRRAGEHKKPVQLQSYPSFLFDDIPPPLHSIPMNCKYCKTLYHREPTGEERDKYWRRQEEFRKKLLEPFIPFV
jgi:hypothetical protein